MESESDLTDSADGIIIADEPDDGRVVAEGSIWKIYFSPGMTPQSLSGGGIIKATLIQKPLAQARVTPGK